MKRIMIMIFVFTFVRTILSARGPSQAELDATATFTPTLTPTPALDLMALVPALEDLPAGFVEVPEVSLVEVQQSMPEGATMFAYSDAGGFELIMGILFPVPDRVEQAASDASMRQFVEFYLSALGSETEFEDLAGLDGIGEVRAAASAVSPVMSFTFRWDTVGFRRGEVLAVLLVGYPDGDEPQMPLFDFAQLMDGRIMLYLSGDDMGNTLDVSPGTSGY